MTIKNNLPKLFIAFLLFLTACNKEPNIDNETMLDGNQLFDPSLYNPAEYLTSVAIDSPTATQLNTPVIITVHGYTASTFEWNEFRDYSDATTNILISQVLLGGHGRTYEEFKNSTWEDWQEPIMTEYNALRNKGYTNINFAGSSTACSLMMNLIKENKIGDNEMNHIFLIDPIVISSNKLLSLLGVFGPMLGFLETTNTPTEDRNWYRFRPQETLNELMDVINIVRKDLQAGYNLPAGTTMKVYKSTKDPAADAASAVLIYKGLKNSDGSNIDIEMIDSEIHVVTRLEGRDDVTQKDRNIQIGIFDDIIKTITQ